MYKISKRQQQILDFIQKNEVVSNNQISTYLSEKNEKISRFTVIRDLEDLLIQGIIVKSGKGRGILYKLVAKSGLLSFFDTQTYFEISPDERKILHEKFNFKIFEEFKDSLFFEKELLDLKNKNDAYQKRIAQSSSILLKKEFERLTIELSWKSSKIEGNTYSLLDTEMLILEKREAVGHKKEEAIMILNHKKALDYVFDQKNNFKDLTLAKIENVHTLVTDSLGVQRNIRKRLVGITGTRFKPLDNEFQIKEALEKTISIVNDKKVSVLDKAVAIIVLVSYIQPFEDGNKRTARILGNAILFAYGYCPLSYRSIDEADYKKATLLFYEQNSALFFKKLFIEQFKFAVENYFG